MSCHEHTAKCDENTCTVCDCCNECPDDCNCPGCTQCGCADYATEETP